MSRVLAAALLLAVAAPAAAETPSTPKVKLTPWLGVSIGDREALWGGVAVLDVFEGTPASLCGIRIGDEILTIGKTDVRSSLELQRTVGARDVGDKVAVRYMRGGVVKRCVTRLAQKITDATELLERRLVDKAVPPFTFVRRGDDDVVDDGALRGRVTVLALFTTSCDCTQAIQDLAARVGDVVAVTGDGADAVDAFVQRTGLATDIALDDGTFVRRYLGEPTEPTIVVIDHEGVVRFAASGAGPDGAHLEAAELAVARAERARQNASSA